MSTFRRSIRIFRVRQISSATSVGVTEPNSEPVGPDLTLEAENRLPEHLGDPPACSVLRASFFARWASTARLGHAGRRRHLGQAARQEVVAGVPARDVDDVPAQPELLDVLEQDELHRYWETYGRSAISRARFTAAATWS